MHPSVINTDTAETVGIIETLTIAIVPKVNPTTKKNKSRTKMSYFL